MNFLSSFMFLMVVWGCSVQGADPSKTAVAVPTGELEKVQKKYSAATSVTMDLEKTVVMALLKKSSVSKGQLVIKGSAKFRIDMKTPERSAIIVNPKTLWLVEFPSKGSKEKIRVTRAKVRGPNRAQIFLTRLLGRGQLLEHFSVKEREQIGDRVTFSLEPKGNAEDIAKATLAVNTKTSTIADIGYWDALENETKLVFSNIKFGKPLSEKLFNYSVPKGADVVDVE